RAPHTPAVPSAVRPQGLDPLLLAATGMLCLFGILMVYSSSAVISMSTYGSAGRIISKHLVSLAVGCALLALCASFDYRRLRDPRIVYAVLGFTALLLVALFFMP